MENLLTGYTKFRSKKFPILWTGNNAEHVTHTYLGNENEPLQIEIQKALQSAKNRKFGTAIAGIKEYPGFTIEVIWTVKSNKALIKTAHRRNSTERLLLKNRGVAGTKKKTPVFTEEHIDDSTLKWLNDNALPIDEYIKLQNTHLKEKYKKS